MRLKTEVSVEINKGLDGTINVFLTEGSYETADHLRESQTKCGIRLHTHPFFQIEGEQFRNAENFCPPSPADFLNSIKKAWSSRFTAHNDVREVWEGIPQKYLYSREYVFDGKVLWSYRANDQLLNVLKNLPFDDSNWITSLLKKLFKFTLIDFLKGKLTLIEYKEEMMNQGIELGFDKNWKQRTVEVNENLDCTYERRERHLVFPSAQLLNSEDLEILYTKAIKILESRKKQLQSSLDFGGGKTTYIFPK